MNKLKAVMDRMEDQRSTVWTGSKSIFTDEYKFGYKDAVNFCIKQLMSLEQHFPEATVHTVKIHPLYLDDVIAGIKTFEIRKNDRNYQIGDILILKEYVFGEYTGREFRVKVTYITDYEQQSGYVVLGIIPVKGAV